MHFIDVGLKNSCSCSTDFYYSETNLYGLTENDEEVNVISWLDINGVSIKKININLDVTELNEIRSLLINKKQNRYSALDLSFVNKEKIKRKDVYGKE